MGFFCFCFFLLFVLYRSVAHSVCRCRYILCTIPGKHVHTYIHTVCTIRCTHSTRQTPPTRHSPTQTALEQKGNRPSCHKSHHAACRGSWCGNVPRHIGCGVSHPLVRSAHMPSEMWSVAKGFLYVRYGRQSTRVCMVGVLTELGMHKLHVGTREARDQEKKKKGEKGVRQTERLDEPTGGWRYVWHTRTGTKRKRKGKKNRKIAPPPTATLQL